MGVSDLSDFHYSGEGAELVDSPATPSRYVGAFVWGLFLSQVSLAAIWLALGLSALPLRFIIVSTILLVLNVGIFHLTQQGPDLSFGLIFTGEMALAVAVPLFAARYFGLRFVDWRHGRLYEIEPSGPERWQYSLRYLFGLMTALAVVLGMLKFIVTYDSAWQLVREQLEVATTDLRCQSSIVLHVLVAWAALCVALGVRLRLRLWLAIALITATFVTCLTLSICLQRYNAFSSWWYHGGPHLWHHGNSPWWHYGWRDEYWFGEWIGPWTLAAFYCLEAALLLGSLWIFRLAGYRVVFRRSVTEEEGGKVEGVKV